MQNMMTQILFIFNLALLQDNKSGNFSGYILRNTKPKSLYFKFVYFKRKSRNCTCALFVSFSLKLAILRLKYTY